MSVLLSKVVGRRRVVRSPSLTSTSRLLQIPSIPTLCKPTRTRSPASPSHPLLSTRTAHPLIPPPNAYAKLSTTSTGCSVFARA